MSHCAKNIWWAIKWWSFFTRMSSYLMPRTSSSFWCAVIKFSKFKSSQVCSSSEKSLRANAPRAHGSARSMVLHLKPIDRVSSSRWENLIQGNRKKRRGHIQFGKLQHSSWWHPSPQLYRFYGARLYAWESLLLDVSRQPSLQDTYNDNRP